MRVCGLVYRGGLLREVELSVGLVLLLSMRLEMVSVWMGENQDSWRVRVG